MVVPTTYPALHDPEAYPDPDSFDPQRWITGDAEEQHKNWLVFGTGPHVCIGQTYATLHLMAMLCKASLKLDWRHEVTDKSEEISIFATIFPKVSCSDDGAAVANRGRTTACWRLRRGREGWSVEISGRILHRRRGEGGRTFGLF
jgi:Cytochrome P450